MQSLTRALKTHWRWIMLAAIALAPRLYLLGVFDVELSQDGFEAVRTLTIWQTQGVSAIPRDLVDRFILHPLYMLLLAALKIVTPASVDFYFVARLLSSLIACVAIVLMFELVRRAFGEIVAWIAALLLAFAPSFLWESAAILSSTLFLALYLAVLLALVASRYRVAAFLAFLSAITRYEGVVLLALVFVALLVRDVRNPYSSPPPRRGKGQGGDWLVFAACALAFPLTLVAGGWLATGNALEFIGAQSMASIWLRFLAPGDFARRGAFFITQYPALFPAPIVWLGVAGAIIALVWRRTRATALLFLTSALYLVFFEALVWLNYTTLEVRFLMYPGLPLLVFAGVALAEVQSLVNSRQSTVGSRQSTVDSRQSTVGSRQSTVDSQQSNHATRNTQYASRNTPHISRLTFHVSRLTFHVSRLTFHVILALLIVALLGMSYQQAVAGMRFVYNMHASQREVADELARLLPLHRQTNVLVYGGIAGALDFYAQQRGLDLAFTYFRFAPDENPEQYVIDHQIQFVIYPVGNAFAKAKYPYLARFETQTQRGVTFQPLTQFATTLDNQLYSIWAVVP